MTRSALTLIQSTLPSKRRSPSAAPRGAAAPRAVESSLARVRSIRPFIVAGTRWRLAVKAPLGGRLTEQEPTAVSTGKEFVMTISEQVDALQAKAAELKSALEASRHETSEQIKARTAEAKTKANAAHKAAHEGAEQTAGRPRGQWQSFQADMSARMRELPARMDRKHDEHDAKAAERDAEAAEDGAADALDFASWAFDEAEVAVLYAAHARARANARAAASAR